MTSLAQKVTHFLSTPKTAEAQGQSPTNMSTLRKLARHTGTNSEYRSRTASSCELFGMFKALAAGQSDDLEQTEPEMDAYDDVNNSPQVDPSSDTNRPLQRAESSATVRPDAATDERNEETFQRYMEASGQTLSQKDANKLAGELENHWCYVKIL